MTRTPVQHYLIVAMAAMLFAANGFAGFGNEEFEEDPSQAQDTPQNWPEISFPSLEERGAGFRPGERFEYRAQWGLFRKAGKITIETLASQVGDAPKLQVNTVTASAGVIRAFYPMTLKASATLDPTQWRMERNEVDGKTRSDVNNTLTLIDYEENILTFEDKAEPDRNKTRPLPYRFPLDYSSSLLQLRGYDLKVGNVYPIFVSSKGKFYLVEMAVTEIEEQRTKLGQRDCFRLEPVKAVPESKLFREGGKMAIWVTNDEERLPVRFDVKTSVGTATIRLDSYEFDGEPELAKL